MITFNNVTLKNFWSVGNSEKTIPLNNNQSYLIIGDNYDVGERGYSRNGVGKSALFLAIQYALFGDTIESIRADGYVNLKNRKNMKVSIDFNVGKDHYQIVRGRKPTYAKVFKNGEDVSRDTIENTTKYIESVLGMTLDVFKNTVLFDPNINPFMSLKPAQQKEFIEKLLSLDVLTERANTLKEMRKSLKNEIHILEKEREMVNTQREKIQSRINSLTEERDAQAASIKEKQKSLEKELKDLNQIDIEEEKKRSKQKEELEKELSDINTSLNEAKRKHSDALREISDIDESLEELNNLYERRQTSAEQKKELEDDVQDLKQQVENNKEQKKLIHEIDGFQSWLDRIQREITDLQDQIDQNNEDLKVKLGELKFLEDSTCPYCEQHYDNEEKKKSVQRSIQALKDTISQQEKDKNEKIASYNENKKKRDEKQKMITLSLQEIDRIEKEYNQKSQKLEMYDASYIDERITALEQKFTEDPETIKQKYRDDEKQQKSEINRLSEKSLEITQQINEIGDVFTLEECHQFERNKIELETELNGLTTNEEFYNDQIKNAEKELEEMKFDEKNYQIMKNRYDHIELLIKLLTDNKSFVRRRIVDQYVPFLNQKINEYSEYLGLPHHVSIGDDLAVEIEYLGSSSIQYGNMSNGQRLRLNLATSMAFNKLCSMLGKKSNAIFVDEYMDSSLDKEGVMKAFDFLKSFADNVFIISHREEFAPHVDSNLYVTLKNGYTDFVFET